MPRSSCLASKPPPYQQGVMALCSTFCQHNAGTGQECAINANIETKLVPNLLFEELSQITLSGLRSPPSALPASSSYQWCNSPANLFCLQQHQLFHTWHDRKYIKVAEIKEVWQISPVWKNNCFIKDNHQVSLAGCTFSCISSHFWCVFAFLINLQGMFQSLTYQWGQSYKDDSWPDYFLTLCNWTHCNGYSTILWPLTDLTVVSNQLLLDMPPYILLFPELRDGHDLPF